MKRFLAILLSVLIVFATFGTTISAKIEDYDFITVEQDFGEVYFNADFAEIGKEITVSVKGREKENFLYKWYVDGMLIDNHTNSYTPLECDLQAMLEVEVFDFDGILVGKKSMLVSELPVIYIETENRQTITSKEKYIDAHIKIQGNAEFSSSDVLYDGETEIRGRGNSTWQADKKPYKLKLESKADLFGMGENKHWTLISNPFDTSLLRNAVSYGLAADMGLDYQKSVWVDLVLNGRVVGNYQLCEHIRVDETRVDITNWEDVAEDAAKAIYKKNQDIMTKDERDELIDIMTEDMSWTTSDKVTFNNVSYTVSDYFDYPDINGGYLLEVVRNVEEHTFSTDRGTCIAIDTPEAFSDNMLNYIQGYYQAFENALYSEDFCTTYNGQTMRYTDFIDLESFAKGLLVNEIFENFDFGRTSTWMYKDIDGKLVYGPVWDMDCTTSSPSFYKWTSHNIKWLSRLLSDPVFLEELRKAYFDYRYTAINDLIKDGGDIDTAIEKIASSAKHNDKIWNNQIGFEENAYDLKLRLQTKISWLDKALCDLNTAYDSIAYGISNMDFVNSDKILLSLDRSTNYLHLTFEDTVPALVKIFADGKDCGKFNPRSTSAKFALPKIADDAVISAVGYDKDGKVIVGSSLSTQKKITSLEITSMPDKLAYNAGEALDLNGLVLTATYSDSSTQTVKPDLAYTYVKDSIGEPFFSYGKVTEEIGETYVVLGCNNAFAEFKINVNPRENYEDVSELIANLPLNISGNRFVKELFEVQVAFDALSDSAKSKVTNKAQLESLMKQFDEKNQNNGQSVVACVAQGAFRINSRNNLIVFAKDDIRKIVFTSFDGSTATYAKDHSAYLTEKKVGNYTISTIKQFVSNNPDAFFKIKATYYDGHSSEMFEISVANLDAEVKNINNISFDKWINSGDTLEVRINKDSEIGTVRLYENGENINASSKVSDGEAILTKTFTQTGKHTLTVKYLYGGSRIEYDSFDVFVREKSEGTNRLYGVDFPEETYSKTITVKAVTSTDVSSVTLESSDKTVPLASKVVGDYKIWTAEADITDGRQYTLKVNGQDSGETIKSTVLDSFEVDGTTLVKFLADTQTAEIPEYITEIADGAFDGFEGTIYCYKDSAAEKHAKDNGIKYQTFEIKVNNTELRINSGATASIEISASPFLPSDFELKAEFDESVISFDGKTVTGLKPGYTRLELSSKYSAYSETVYIYVGGGPRKADINADEKINSTDALLVLQTSVEKIELNAVERIAADVNGDGKVNSIDALSILQISVGKSSVWDYI